MGTFLSTLAVRMILVGLTINAVLLPALFYGLLYIFKTNIEERFVNDVRVYSRFLAEFIELEGVVEDFDLVARLLDGAILGSEGVYAELIIGGERIKSKLQIDHEMVYKEDFKFGQHQDDVYFLSIQMQKPGKPVVLRMGFDEEPTANIIREVRWQLASVLFIYLFISILASVFMSARMTKPLRKLQNASRNIAIGQYNDQLQVDTRLSEIRDLASDLEVMRSEIVGTNASLMQQIREKQAADDRRELLENRLMQSQKLETVGVLAGGIAHEFNNILLPIFLYTEQAMDDLPKDSPVRAQLERVLRSSNRAKNLVQQILTFSRQSGKQEFRPVDIKPVVEESLELLRALIPSTVELSRHLTDDECMVLADRNQIHQMVINLCSNAYLALDESGGKITVELDRYSAASQMITGHPDLEPGKYIRMSVKDTGRGMDRGNLDRVFEPFYTTRAVGKGTGLGLSVVHGIVISHNGEITVESEPGKGTVFNVYLPEIGRSEQ